jgi:hypothetical protein
VISRQKKLKMCPALNEFLLLDVELKYRVKNITAGSRVFPVTLQLEKFRNSKIDDKFVKAYLLEIGPDQYNEDGIMQLDKKSPDTELHKVYEYADKTRRPC